MKIQDLELSALMTPAEFQQFNNIFTMLGQRYKTVVGILATGSYFQHNKFTRFDAHANFNSFLHDRDNPYFAVDHAKSRNLSFNKKSDIDIWVALKDYNLPKNILHKLNEEAIKVMEKRGKVTKEQWANLSFEMFNEYCKNPRHYTKEWTSANKGEFWKSKEFQSDAIRMMTRTMPEFCNRYNYFCSSSLENLLEVRAFPESLLHVKLVRVDTAEHQRVPIPVYIKSWLTKYNTHTLFASPDATIYPFKREGIVLGEDIGKHFGLDKLTDEQLYVRGF